MTGNPSVPFSGTIYEKITESTTDGFWLLDRQGRIIDTNETASTLLGYSRDELLTMGIADIDAKENPAEIAAHVDKIASEGHGRFQTVHRRKDGRHLDVEVSTHFIDEGEGYFVAFVSDISERKRLEQELRAERDLNRRYLEVASVMFVAIDTDQQVALINRKGCEILGYERSEIVGRNWFDLVVPAEEKDNVKAVFAKLVRGEVKPVEYYENHVVTKSGGKRLIAWTNNYTFDEAGDIGFVISCGLDITEKRRAEEAIIEEHNKLEAVMTALDEGITVQDRQFRILYQNKQHQTMQGNQRGAHCFTAYQKKDAICPGCLLVKCFEDGQIHRREVVAQGKDGDRLYLEVAASPVLNARGEIVAGVEAVRDISDRKKLEHEAQRARNLESLGIFAGGIAHDFNNLLTGVIGNLSFVQHQLRQGKGVEQPLAAMEEACGRAKKLIGQLLTFSKGDAPVMASASIEEIATNSTAFVLQGSKVKTETHFPANLWVVDVDSGQISQVFQNLAQNAVQAMPEGGTIEMRAANVEVSPESHPHLTAGRYVKVTFTDTGSGIDPNVLPKIFDPYFTTKEQGSGLGLAISFSIVRKHHGHLEASSQPGRGATFTLWLPASAEAAPPSPVPSTAAVITPGQGRILIMDDEEMIRQLAARMLTALGYRADVAKDGDEMLDLYRTARSEGDSFAAVIMDLTIPGGMGGKEAISRLLELDPQARAIVSSGYSNDPIIANHVDFGFSGVIAKPFTLAELSEALGKAINCESRPSSQEG